MTIDITDYCYVNGCSVVGLMVGETVSVRELFYGTILPSGADAALGLATYVAGSQEAFVALMNEKLEELGIADTAHFTNCVGLYDENHKCTVSDMAVILEAAMDNALCREVLGARTYETAPTTDHPEGQILSNWFLRRIEDKDTGGIDRHRRQDRLRGGVRQLCRQLWRDGGRPPLHLRDGGRRQFLAGHLRSRGAVQDLLFPGDAGGDRSGGPCPSGWRRSSRIKHRRSAPGAPPQLVEKVFSTSCLRFPEL